MFILTSLHFKLTFPIQRHRIQVYTDLTKVGTYHDHVLNGYLDGKINSDSHSAQLKVDLQYLLCAVNYLFKVIEFYYIFGVQRMYNRLSININIYVD